MSSAGTGRVGGLTLDYPMSLGVFEKYEDAQQAVDFLSDRDFPVENCMIVGTDLRQVERVTGRLTLGRVAIAGLVSGIWMGLFVGLIFALFSPAGDAFTTILWAMAFGAVFALVWTLLGHALTRGQRDFTSVSQVIATRYEVLTEHKHAQRARDLLLELPGGPVLTDRPQPQPQTTPPQQTTPQETGAPQQAAPQQTAPQQTAAPQQAAPQQTGAPQQTAPPAAHPGPDAAPPPSASPDAAPPPERP